MIPVRYADIDLSNGQVRDYPLSENVVRMFLGGKGLAAYILYQELAPGRRIRLPLPYFLMKQGSTGP